MKRWILHADMDAFYASVEQRDHPEWRGKPVIVGATSPRGVVSAASYEARRYGVHSAMPGFRARQLCPHGIFVAGDMEKYAAISREVHGIFAEVTDAIEPLALDEAFLDISGSVSLLGPPLEIGRRIKKAVVDRLGLTVSVGIAPNKLVAKIACGLSKPDGLLLVEPEEVRGLLDPLPVRKLWGVGPRTEAALAEAGLKTFGDLARADLGRLRRVVGNRAEELRLRAQGIDERPVVSHRAPKSIGEEATFEADVTDPEVISDALTSHAEAVARRARRAGLVGRTVIIKVKLGRARGSHAGRTPGEREPDYPLLSRSRSLDAPTADGAVLRRVALELWQRAAIREPVRLLGVTLSNLQSHTPPADTTQLSLFGATAAPAREQRSEALSKTLDAIEAKFGRHALHRAVRTPAKLTQSDRRKVGEEPDDS